MNLAIRGIDGNLGPYAADSFHEDLHPDLKANYILANPPFNISDWGGNFLEGDKRWQYGTPPTGNANYAWIQHMLHHRAPTGRAGFVLANGSMSSGMSGEGDIRQRLVRAGLVDCMVALPPQLFFNTQIAAPGRYVGAADVADDGEPFEEKMERLVTTLEEQMAASVQLDSVIRENLGSLGW